ncbi:MAG: carboxypeptidase [Pedobacter sp.]|nr:MAG: carboxypeptidase [Pedobacter sp.]
MHPNYSEILEQYPTFKNSELKNRTFLPSQIERAIKKLKPPFKVNLIGQSVENRNIYSITWGTGPLKIFAWSQMHGDEATGTMALFDLFGFLSIESDASNWLKNNLELHFIPMVNPDGAHYFTRRNAQQIDINRDFLQCLSPEAKILKEYFNKIKPAFGFNLHDQDTLWGIRESKLPATLSFLAPAYNKQLEKGLSRFTAMQVIADIHQKLASLLPGQIGLFDDEYEPRAFGDNFQAGGCATILIEAGGFPNDDEKQEIRKLYFYALLSGIFSICTKNYLNFNEADYLSIPLNTKPLFHLLIKDATMPMVKASIGLNYQEIIDPISRQISKLYSVEDIGDLSPWAAYREVQGKQLSVIGNIKFGNLANFDVLEEGQLLFGFRDGIIY